jgi:hypothetical protein
MLGIDTFMEQSTIEIIRLLTFVLLCVFLYLGLQAYSYMENYDKAVKVVDKAYKEAYANLSCCVCMGNLNDIDQFNNPFSHRPNVTINESVGK